MGILEIENSLQPVRIWILDFGYAAGSAGNDGVGLIHGVDVVVAGCALLCPAGVFHIAGHSALAVEVVGLVALLKKTLDGILDHILGRVLVVVKILGVGFVENFCRALESKGVDCDILRVQGNNFLQSVLEGLVAVALKSGDEIHVDIVHALFPCKVICLDDLLGGVTAADVHKDRVLESLRIDADPGDAQILESSELSVSFVK